MIFSSLFRNSSLGLALALASVATPGLAAAPAVKIEAVGAISINPSHDAKVLAEWYAKFGFTTKEVYGGFYGQLDTPGGPLVFGIHPKKKHAPEQSSASVAIVLRVADFAAALASLKENGLTPESTEEDAMGKFAHFHDPDGNKVSIWGK